MNADTTDTFDTTPETAPRGSLGEAVKRGSAGLVEGAQTGAMIGTGLICCAYLGELALGSPGTITGLLFHGADPVIGSLTLTAAHSVGAAAFEGISEAVDGYKGVGEHDHIKDTAEKLDEKLLELEAPSRQQQKAQAYQFDNPNPATNAGIDWRTRIAAQQTLQNAQDRTV